MSGDHHAAGRMLFRQRRILGLTQAQLGEAANVSEKRISEIERGVGGTPETADTKPDLSCAAPVGCRAGWDRGGL